MFVLFVCAQRKRTKQTLFAVCHATNQSSGMAHPLAEQIGITFRDERLLQCAIIHRSFINEHPERVVGLESNERLEFLGDSILNFLTADWLYRRYTDHSEGGLNPASIEPGQYGGVGWICPPDRVGEVDPDRERD
jgi:hypothetical protein